MIPKNELSMIIVIVIALLAIVVLSNVNPVGLATRGTLSASNNLSTSGSNSNLSGGSSSSSGSDGGFATRFGVKCEYERDSSSSSTSLHCWLDKDGDGSQDGGESDTDPSDLCGAIIKISAEAQELISDSAKCDFAVACFEANSLVTSYITENIVCPDECTNLTVYGSEERIFCSHSYLDRWGYDYVLTAACSASFYIGCEGEPKCTGGVGDPNCGLPVQPPIEN